MGTPYLVDREHVRRRSAMLDRLIDEVDEEPEDQEAWGRLAELALVIHYQAAAIERAIEQKLQRERERGNT